MPVLTALRSVPLRLGVPQARTPNRGSDLARLGGCLGIGRGLPDRHPNFEGGRCVLGDQGGRALHGWVHWCLYFWG